MEIELEDNSTSDSSPSIPSGNCPLKFFSSNKKIASPSYDLQIHGEDQELRKGKLIILPVWRGNAALGVGDG